MTVYPNPGAIGNMPPTPNVVESTWGNAIRDRVVNNFDTTGHRDAAIGSPVEGMYVHIAGRGLQAYSGAASGWTDAGYRIFDTAAHRDNAITAPQEGMQAYVAGSVHQFLVYAGATDTWQPPWNLPWGRVAQAKKTSSQTGITTVVDVSGLTLTVTALANRLWRVSCYIPLFTQNTSAAVIQTFLQTGASGAGTQIQDLVLGLAASGQFSGYMESADQTTTAASLSYHIRCQNSGAGTTDIGPNTTLPALLSIEDVGSAGAPA